MSKTRYMPIEIINKILSYIGDLNNSPVIMQFLYNNKEHYKINFSADSLLDIQAILRAKQLYPIRMECPTIFRHRELYKYCKKHYKKEIRNNTMKNDIIM